MDIITIDDLATVTVSVDTSGDTIVINPVAESIDDALILIAQNSEDIGELNDLMSTSWTSGAIISINVDPTKFDVTAGEGQHVDHSFHPPVVTQVSVPASTGNIVTNLATQTTTEVAVDKNGNLVQQFRFTPEERRDVFSIGSFNHANLASILSVQPLARVLSHEVALTTADLALAIGSITTSGVIVQPDGANLKFNVTAGETFVLGIDKTNVKRSNYVNSAARVEATFFYAYQDGAGGFNLTVTDTLTPLFYDDGTGGVTVPNGAVGTNKWTLMRVYVFPTETPAVSTVVVHYGTQVFDNVTDALNDLGIDFTPHPVLTNAVHRANIAVRGNAVDLNDTTTAIIQTVSKFGGAAGGGGIGGATSDHELLSNLLGGATNDHQHLTTAELTKLGSIETGATADQTKADIDGLGIDAETLDGLDSTDFELVAKKDATGGYAGLTLFKINFKNAANTFTNFFTNATTAARTYTFQDRNGTIADDSDIALTEKLINKDATGGYAGLTLLKINFKNVANTFTSFFTNTNTAARTYTFQNRDGTIADNTDIAGREPADADILKADTTDQLSVGYTTTVEALTSDTIVPDFTKQSLKTRTTAGNITISNPTTGQGVMHIVFTIDASGPRTVTYGTEVKPVVGAPTSLTASAVYLMTLVRDTATHTIASILEVA